MESTFDTWPKGQKLAWKELGQHKHQTLKRGMLRCHLTHVPNTYLIEAESVRAQSW